VLRRDNQRCRVDGCTHHLFLDVHHIHPRAEGGTHDPQLLISLCGRHHAAAHRGALVIDGTASDGFRFFHADGKAYGGVLHPRAIEVAQQVLSALKKMGFKEKHARALIDAVLQKGAPEDTAAFLRAALRAT
jgi:hypothetical protein